jgi:hypothetical protein
LAEERILLFILFLSVALRIVFLEITTKIIVFVLLKTLTEMFNWGIFKQKVFQLNLRKHQQQQWLIYPLQEQEPLGFCKMREYVEEME